MTVNKLALAPSKKNPLTLKQDLLLDTIMIHSTDSQSKTMQNAKSLLLRKRLRKDRLKRPKSKLSKLKDLPKNNALNSKCRKWKER